MDVRAISREVYKGVAYMPRDVSDLVAGYAIGRVPQWNHLLDVADAALAVWGEGLGQIMVADEPLQPYDAPGESDGMKSGRWALQISLQSEDAAANVRWFVWFNLFVASNQSCVPRCASKPITIGSDAKSDLCVVDGDVLEFEMNYLQDNSIKCCLAELTVWVRSRRRKGHRASVTFDFPKQKPIHFMAVSIGPRPTLSFVPPNSVHRSKK